MKGIATALLFLTLIVYFGFVLWANRALYFSKFDSQYWVDKFEHSQWRIPQSRRVIGDDGLYLYQGYRLIQGGDPTTSNAEAPPLGKYLIGTSIQTLGNGYWYGYIVTAGALVAFFFLARILLANTALSILLTLALALDPMIANQFQLTMLDSLQLLLLELTLIFFLCFLRGKNHSARFVFLAGLTFGLFSCTKIPIFSPFFAVLFLFYIWRRTKKIPLLMLFLAAATLGYLLPYLPYFFMGHSLREWTGVQRYVVSFYLRGYTPPNIGSLLTTLLFDRTQNMFTRMWEPVSQWSLTWPWISVATIAGAVYFVKKRALPSPHIIVLVSLAIIMIPYLFIPFWARYLVIILPLLYLTTALLLTQKSGRFAVGAAALLLLVNGWFVTQVFFPTPQATVKQFTYDWEHGFFQDMYESLTHSSKTAPRAAFHRFGQKTFYDGQIEAAHIAIRTDTWSSWQTEQRIPLQITYMTRHLGTFEHTVTLPVINENGRWRIQWDWKLLLSDFNETATLKTTVVPAKRGSIIGKNTLPLARDGDSYLIWITPGRVDTKREDEMNSRIHLLLQERIAAVSVHSRYVENTQPDLPIPIGVIMQPIDSRTLLALQSFPGVSLTPAYGRFINTSADIEIGTVKNSLFAECCSVLYNTTSYDGASGLEKYYNETLKGRNGGTLELLDPQGRTVRTLINRSKKDGQSVQL